MNEKAIEKYVSHLLSCPQRYGDKLNPCTCGLDQALAELAKQDDKIASERVRNLETLLQYKQKIRMLQTELAEKPVCETCGGTHYLDKDDNPVAINTNSPGWKYCPDCKQPPAGEFTPKKNYIEDYLSKTRYRLTTGTRDEEMDKFARWFLEACTLLDQQAERIEQLEVSLEIAVDYVKNPNSRRTLEGQLKDIETGHY